MQAVNAEIIDRVVAYVDDTAITESELNEKYEHMKEINNTISIEETLDVMINRVLLIKDAKRHRMESKTDDELIEQYIDLKIRSMIKVTEKEVKDYFEENRKNLSGKAFGEVSSEIIRYLTEQKVNERLKENLERLRERSEVVVNVEFKTE